MINFEKIFPIINNASKKAQLFGFIIMLFALLNIISIIPDIFGFMSKSGFVDPTINEKFLTTTKKLTLIDITSFLENLSIPYHFAFILVILAYISSLILFLFGYGKILFSFVACFLHTLILNSSFLTSYGGDQMLSFLLFINIIFSLEKNVPTKIFDLLFSFSIRLTQIQLCIIYFFAGFGKSLGHDYFDGNAIWLTFGLYMNENTFLQIIPYIPPIIYKILSLFTVIIELLYPFLIINRITRKWVVIEIIILHIAIGLLIGLYFFSIFMILLNLIAFYHDDLYTYFHNIRQKITKLKYAKTY